MIRIIPGLKPQNGVPVICDTIEDFYKFEKGFEDSKAAKAKNPFMRVFINEISAELVYFKEYLNEISGSWACRKGCIDNGAVPLAWKPLEDYRN